MLVAKIKKPFSHLIPMNGFPQDVEIWTRSPGDIAKKIADLPSREGTPLTGVEPGPRSYQWRADQPATIVWVEALDGGDLKNKVPFRDKVVSLAAPFSAQPTEVAKTEWRYTRIAYTDTRPRAAGRDPIARHGERAPGSSRRGAAPRKVWDRKQDAAYENPGAPVTRRDAANAAAEDAAAEGRPSRSSRTATTSTSSGEGASPEGDRPFLDRLNREDAASRASLSIVRLNRSSRSSRR